jgi:steroid delta-isomerase-like uncharacterized protein
MTALTTHVLRAQDPVNVAPERYKTLFENDRVRVLEATLKPGQKSPMHSHPAYAAYLLTDGHVRFTFPDGRTIEPQVKAGQVVWSNGITHSEENLSKDDLRVLLFELKPPLGEDANQTLIRQYADLYNTGDLSKIDQIVSPLFIERGPEYGSASIGLDGLRGRIATLRRAFPDLQVTVEEAVIAGNRVTARMTLTGTQRGEFMGLTPSGKAMKTMAVSLFRITDSKIVEAWDGFDRYDLMAQLGVVKELK